MKIRPVGAMFFYADGRTGKYDEANSRFRNFANWPKKGHTYSLIYFPSSFLYIFTYVYFEEYV